MRSPSPLLIALVLLLTLLAPLPAMAHQQLRSASPAAGDSLAAAPREIRLSFAQAVEPSLAELRLVGPRGEVALGELTVPADSLTVLAAAVIGALVAGDYILHWLVTGDDGHPVRGELRFTVREGATGLAAVDSSAVGAVEGPAGTAGVAPQEVPGP